MANGTDALAIALRALGVGPGDEVVVPAFTFYATAEAVAAIGARPVFCDVDPATFCVTAETVRAAITPATRAIVPVHLFGSVAPVAELRELGPPVLEDAAQAAGAARKGARAGALGDAATFSFFPSKNLPCLGDGGAITTHDDDVAARVRRLRFHGSEDKSTFVDVGYNSRLDEIQAAVLRLLLPELDGWNAARAAAAQAYEQAGIARHAKPPVLGDGVQPATTCTSCATTIRARWRRASRSGASRRGATTARRSTASPRWRRSPPMPSCRARTRPPARTSRCPWAHELSEEPGSRGGGRVRIWVDLTNSPHVLVMRPLIERMREDGHEVEVTARDFAQTVQLLERYGMPTR